MEIKKPFSEQFYCLEAGYLLVSLVLAFTFLLAQLA